MLRLFQQFLLFLIISYTDTEPIQGQKFSDGTDSETNV